MGTNEETTEVVETDVKSDEELVVEVIDDVDAVEEKADEAELSEEVEEALQEIKDGETVVVDSEEELAESLDAKDDIDEALEALVVDEDDIRVKHLKSVGLDAEPEEDEFLCGIERKMLQGNVCSHCPGGCAPEGEKKELPGLLDIELKAVDEYGTVIASGYDPTNDMFILNVERKDGKVIEVAYDGSGEGLGWQMLNQEMVSNKDALAGQKVVSFDEAAEVANQELEGSVKGVDAILLDWDQETVDAFVVKIDQEEKSFDAYVRIDGTFLGYDEFFDVDSEIKADMPDGDMPKAPAADKLVGQVSAISDVDTLKSVLEAIGEDVDVVPDEVKMALIATAKKLKAEEYLPKEWMDEGEDAAEEVAEEAAEAAPAVDEKKDLEILVDGEKVDDDFLSQLEEFRSMIKDDDSE